MINRLIVSMFDGGILIQYKSNRNDILHVLYYLDLNLGEDDDEYDGYGKHRHCCRIGQSEQLW